MNKRHIVRICCSDGFITKPDDIRGSVVHEIREPGGILFSNLYARDIGGNDPAVVAELLRIGLDMLVYKIRTMVKLKSPDEIILLAHDPCAAAGILGMATEEVQAAHLEWEERLRQRYPNTFVHTLFEEHSSCGQHRKKHVRVIPQSVAS